MRQLYLAAAGFSRPETRLRDHVSLTEGVAPFPMPDIRTALSPEYLTETKNEDPFQVVSALITTPTVLAAEAARGALQAASCDEQSLGLILGATSTPLQTTPAESQRVGKELGVKIPAYDVHSGGADFALHLETLSSWKADRLPENTLILSTHLPTTRMDFREQVVEHSVFSDGAGAAIVSTTKGPFRVKKAVANIFPSLGEKFSIDVYGHLQVDLSFERSVAVPRLTELLAELRPLLSDNALFVDSQLTPESFRLLESAVGYGNWYSSFSEFGNMFGASPFAAIASLKERGEMDAEHIVLIQSGIGLSVGVVILEREA